MSILPSQAQGSIPSSSSVDSPQNPNPNHGHRLHSPPSLSPPQSSPSPLSRHIQSLQITDPQSPISTPHQNSGPTPAAEDSGRFSQKMNKLETPNGKEVLPHRNAEMHSQCHSGVRGVGSAQSKGKMSAVRVSPRGQQSTGFNSSHGSTSHSAGRRGQRMNGNHLLNFHYDPIVRPQPRPSILPSRQQRKIKPYNKDLFLQANYKFVMLDTGNHAPESMDPDKMLQWEAIICVRYSTPFPVQCPICLEYPLCPQITSCGHIFCFPCIMQYLLMGEEDHKGDCFKRCPLCFVMVSPKDLYTVYIENVKQYSIGDTIEFMLLTRQKDSFALSQKNRLEADTVLCSSDDIYDPFSKFTFTSDVELSVRKAISDLDSWLAKADSGLVDDIEKLPYVCAAMEQLEQRKKYWNEHRACDGNGSFMYHFRKGSQGQLVDSEAGGFKCVVQSVDLNDETKWLGNSVPDRSDVETVLDRSADVCNLLEGKATNLSSSYDENKDLQRHFSGSRDIKDQDSYNFYQAADGQHFILHPLNMKCLLHHYGSYDMLPHRLSGRILQLETVTQSEAMRRRYRYLSHFSLTTTFELCEIDLSEILPPDALLPFMDEINKREKQRKQLAKKERKEKIKAEAATAISVPILSSFGQSSHDHSPTFSMDDFEALGCSTTISSSPPVLGERKLFSSVTKLGFAAGHDSPALKLEENSASHNNEVVNDSSGATGSTNSGSLSFANMISRARSVENLDAPKMGETGKKGKKSSRVLLSTAGGRRY